MGKVNALVRRLLDWTRRTCPLDATTLGLHDEDHRVGDLGRNRGEPSEELKDILRGVPSPKNPDDALDAGALRAHISEILLTSYEMNLPERSAGFMIEEFLSALFHQVNGTYAPPRERFRALLYRLREVQRMLGQVLHVLMRSAEAGKVPTAWTVHGMQVAEEGARYLLTIRRRLGRWLSGASAGPLRRAVSEELTRAARAFLAFQKDVQKRIVPKSSADGYAVGPELFGRILSEAHLMPPDPSDFVKEAASERREILARLNALSLQLCGAADWRAASRTLSADHPPASRLIEAFQREVTGLQTFVKKKNISRIHSDGTIKVMETPVYERASIPYAAYQGPVPFESASRLGYFFVTPPNARASRFARLQHLSEFPKAAILVTAAHEAVPGHHLQHLISHASPRPVRRMVWDSFFGEGWAHYAEGLIFREGFAASKRSEFFLLKDRLWRCVRVSLDVQIHLRGLALARAAQILSDEAGLSREGARGEIVRYSLEPTQPMSYFVGRKFFEDLADAERRRAARNFDSAAFHDRILSFGAVPLPLVRRRLRAQPSA